MKASMDVIRKTAGEMIDQLTEELEIILEEKQKAELYEKRGYLIDAMEAAGYRYDPEAVRMEKSHGRQMECMNYMDLSNLNPGLISRTGWIL